MEVRIDKLRESLDTELKYKLSMVGLVNVGADTRIPYNLLREIVLPLFAQIQRRCVILEDALPDPILLESCGTALGTMAGLYYSGNLKDTFVRQANTLLIAAGCIREVKKGLE